MPSSCKIVNVIKVVNIMRTHHINVGTSIESDRDRLLTSILIIFNHTCRCNSMIYTASEHRFGCGMAHSVLLQGFNYLSTGLRQPRERVKFSRRYLSEKV